MSNLSHSFYTSVCLRGGWSGEDAHTHMLSWVMAWQPSHCGQTGGGLESFLRVRAVGKLSRGFDCHTRDANSAHTGRVPVTRCQSSISPSCSQPFPHLDSAVPQPDHTIHFPTAFFPVRKLLHESDNNHFLASPAALRVRGVSSLPRPLLLTKSFFGSCRF